MVIIFLLKINQSRAAFIVKSNTSYECNCHLDECWTTEAFDSELEWELDMVMNSNIVKMLKSGRATITGNTGNANEPSQQKCPKPPYDSCLPATGSNPNRKGIYCRQGSS
ncbi:hypothetical protein J1N35_002357 [Gossypium stocksii]|uniref:Uncharacterized protein n=1 Tax=Gossypium stocksii TaxID=47602 RepID=A0A9D3WM10_9ROSI|nr:hypothetical protein J1N35_002357 [Gossypium stocksii]